MTPDAGRIAHRGRTASRGSHRASANWVRKLGGAFRRVGHGRTSGDGCGATHFASSSTAQRGSTQPAPGSTTFAELRQQQTHLGASHDVVVAGDTTERPPDAARILNSVPDPMTATSVTMLPTPMSSHPRPSAASFPPAWTSAPLLPSGDASHLGAALSGLRRSPGNGCVTLVVVRHDVLGHLPQLDVEVL